MNSWHSSVLWCKIIARIVSCVAGMRDRFQFVAVAWIWNEDAVVGPQTVDGSSRSGFI